MIRALSLEDFALDATTGPDADSATVGPATAPAEDRDAALAAFDEGYRDGWEDCARAEAEAQRRIAADLATNLRDLTHGYEAARADVLAALGPLFEEMADRLLPRLAAEAVAPAVIAELRRAAERASTARAVLLASPAALPALERLIDTQEGLSVDLVAEPAFAEGQVSLRFDSERRDIDLAEAARHMAEALRTFVADGAAAPHRSASQGAA
jgi:flagellar assembly protein FliH